MAWTITREKTTFGNKKVVLITAVSDAAETNLDTGLSYVDAFTIGFKSCSTGTALPHMAANKNSSGTASNGKIGISGVTSGDEYFIVAYGR